MKRITYKQGERCILGKEFYLGSEKIVEKIEERLVSSQLMETIDSPRGNF